MKTEKQEGIQGLVRLALVALVAGAVTGVAGALFRLTLTWADKTRLEVLNYSHQYPYLGWLIPVIAAAVCVAIARFLVRLEPLASGSGVQHVEAVMRGEAQPAPRGVVPVKFVGGVLAIGAGMVLGREGPTVQMGSVIGSSFGRWLRLHEQDIPSLQAATAGGLFAPLLVVGALFGSLYAGLLQAWLPGLGLDPTAFAIVGMAAFFVGVVRAPFTGIVLVVEMTATTTLLVPLLMASFGAMLAATLLRGEPVYDTLRTRMLRNES